MIIQLIWMIFGFVLLVKGADWFVDGAAGVAAKFGIPQLVVGLTIVAMGTSMPEAAVSISAACKGTADITIGNVVGSNILNVLVVLGLTAVVAPLSVAKSTVQYELPFMAGISVILLACGMSGNIITHLEGVVLWGLFIVYLAYLFRMAILKRQQEETKEKPRHILSLILLIFVGLICVAKGSDITVSAATHIAQLLGMSERFVGLTVVALGTSLPEMATSVSAARKGEVDIAIGNIVGSNVFNFLFVVGTTALIIPVPFAGKFLIDMMVSIGAGLLLWAGVFRRRVLSRTMGGIMLACYAGYFVYLLR